MRLSKMTIAAVLWAAFFMSETTHATTFAATLEQTQARVQSISPPGSIKIITGETAKQWMREFNKMPPATDYTADVLIVSHETSPAYFIFAFEHGCLKGRSVLTKEQGRALDKSTEGVSL